MNATLSENFTIDDIHIARVQNYYDQQQRGLSSLEAMYDSARRGYQIAREWGLKVTIPDWVDQPGYPASDVALPSRALQD